MWICIGPQPHWLSAFGKLWGCRNRLLTCILKLCKENLGRLPKIIGMDVVEMALWAQVFNIVILCRYHSSEVFNLWCLHNTSKDMIVHVSLWCVYGLMDWQAHAKSLPIGGPVQRDSVDTGVGKDEKVSVERELVSKAEEEDMEALLGSYASLSPL